MDNKEHWENVGADYGHSWDPPAMELLSAQELDFVSRHLPPDARAVLDIGIGSGRILDQLLRSTRSAHIFGVDVAESMVRACQERFSGEPRVAQLAVCDIAADPIPFDCHFDFISSIRVLKYSANWPDIVARLVSLLSDLPNGQATLVLSMPNRNSISRFSRDYAVPWETTTRSELVDLCEHLEVHPTEIVGFGRLPFFAYKVRGPRRLATSVIAIERMLGRLFGPTFLARELFVAIRCGGVRRSLGHHPQRLVSFDHGAGIVEKTFLVDGGNTLVVAEEEFRRLQTLSEVVGEAARSASPEPLALLPGPPPTIRMGAVAGRPLLDVLRERRLRRAQLEEAAATAAHVLVAYVAAAGSPYYDFQFDNMLYDEGSATVGFVDLGLPEGGTTDSSGLTPIDVSLGNLIGSTIFQSARPKWLIQRRQRRQAAQLCRSIVRGAGERSADKVRMDGIRRTAQDTYGRCAFGGDRVKRLWYSSVGYVLATRMRIEGTWFGPTPRRQRRPPTSVPGATNKK